MRIKMDLEEFDFVIEHIKGTHNVVADALSRIDIKDLFNLYEENHVFKISIEPSVQNKNSKISVILFTISLLLILIKGLNHWIRCFFLLEKNHLFSMKLSTNFLQLLFELNKIITK